MGYQVIRKTFFTQPTQFHRFIKHLSVRIQLTFLFGNYFSSQDGPRHSSTELTSAIYEDFPVSLYVLFMIDFVIESVVRACSNSCVSGLSTSAIQSDGAISDRI
jgi:hypothetical protein